jgi:PAS domain S-box-containing protein
MIKKIYWPIAVIGFIGYLSSILGYQELNQIEDAKLLSEFTTSSSVRVDAIELNIDRDILAVRVVKSLFESQKNVSRTQFHDFVTPILERGSSIQALEWIPRVPISERYSYKEDAVNDGLTDFFFKELSSERKMITAHIRDEYYPVYYVEPMAGNEGALGFDLSSNPSRLGAINNAIKTGKITTSERITLAQNGQAGILIFNPVYNSFKLDDAISANTREFTGFALGVIQISKMIENAYTLHPELVNPAGIDFYFFDISDEVNKPLIYVHNSRERNDILAPVLKYSEAISGVYYARVIAVGNRSWKIIAKPLSETSIHSLHWFPFHSSHWPSWIALTTGFVMTTSICLLLLLYINKRRDVEALVESRTRDLNDTKNRVSAIVENTAEGIITIGRKGIIETVNPATERIFGFSTSELIGQNVNILMPKKEQENHDGYLKNSNLHLPRIINASRDLEGRRKDGSKFPMDLNVSTMTYAGEKKFVGLIRDITERKQAEVMKSEFVSTVSHELRTPLTSILGSLSLIKGGSVGELPEKMLRMLNIAHNNSERLVRLINDILDVEKIESGEMVYDMKPIDVGDLIEQSIMNNEAYAKLHDTKYIIGNITPGLKVLGDSSRLTQTLANLMSNAAKFSSGDPGIILSSELVNVNVRVSVTDHGEGIPDKFKPLIFSKFSQADPSDTRQKGGSGLGLNITKAIIEHHNGKINFETEVGKGTTFYFEIPIFIEDVIQPNPNNHFRILICEDEPDIARLLSIMLQEEGYNTDIAANASEVLSKITTNTYHAMTLDICMPDKDGISLLKDMRANPDIPDIPVVVVSVNATKDKGLINGDAIGILDWIDKPIDQQRLVNSIHSAVSKSVNQSPKILHVEDEPDVITIVASLVEEMNIGTITPAMTFADAKRKLQENSYDLVILDLILPDGRGEDLLPLLNNQNGTATPVIIFSIDEISNNMAGKVDAALLKSQTSNEKLMMTVKNIIDTMAPKDQSIN